MKIPGTFHAGRGAAGGGGVKPSKRANREGRGGECLRTPFEEGRDVARRLRWAGPGRAIDLMGWAGWAWPQAAHRWV